MFTRTDGRPLDPQADWEEFKELLAEAGIDDRRLYDGSRHTAGTILNELGVDIVTIMEILRHTQISQTRRYVKGRSYLSKDAMSRMATPSYRSRSKHLLRPEVRPPTANQPAPSADAASGKGKAPGHGE